FKSSHPHHDLRGESRLAGTRPFCLRGISPTVREGSEACVIEPSLTVGLVPRIETTDLTAQNARAHNVRQCARPAPSSQAWAKDFRQSLICGHVDTCRRLAATRARRWFQ